MILLKKYCAVLIALLTMCALCLAVAVPVAADGEPIATVTTGQPVILPSLTQATEEPTVTVPTVVTPETPVTIPTVVTPPETTVTVPTMVTMPTTEPPITIEPTSVGGGKGYIDTYCNVDGAAVAFDGMYQCTIAQGVCTVGVSPTGHVQTVTVTKSGYTTWSGGLSGMPSDG